MQNYARLNSHGVVAETIQTSGPAPEAHPSVIFLSCAPEVVQGWRQENGTFVPPPPPTTDFLLAVSARFRYVTENKNIVVNGKLIAANRDARATLVAEIAALTPTPDQVVDWKYADGTWASLNVSGLTALAAAISAHKQACFAVEREAATNIGLTITTVEQVIAAYAAL